MNKIFRVFAPVCSLGTFAVFGILATGCLGAEPTGTDEPGAADEIVAVDQAALKDFVELPDVARSDNCMCTCRGVTYGPVKNPSPTNQGCMIVCHNFFFNNPGLCDVDGAGYPITIK